MPLGMTKVGLLAAAGGVDAGAFEPIASQTFNGSTATVTFSGIPQTFAALRLIVKTAVSSSHSADYHVGVQINGDTGSNYRYQY